MRSVIACLTLAALSLFAGCAADDTSTSQGSDALSGDTTKGQSSGGTGSESTTQPSANFKARPPSGTGPFSGAVCEAGKSFVSMAAAPGPGEPTGVSSLTCACVDGAYACAPTTPSARCTADAACSAGEACSYSDVSLVVNEDTATTTGVTADCQCVDGKMACWYSNTPDSSATLSTGNACLAGDVAHATAPDLKGCGTVCECVEGSYDCHEVCP